MRVRFLLLVVLAVAIVTGHGGPADAGSEDQIAQVMETSDAEPMDALGVELAGLSGPTLHVIPVVLRGTDTDHASLEPARVFRPPRVSFV